MDQPLKKPEPPRKIALRILVEAGRPLTAAEVCSQWPDRRSHTEMELYLSNLVSERFIREHFAGENGKPRMFAA